MITISTIWISVEIETDFESYWTAFVQVEGSWASIILATGLLEREDLDRISLTWDLEFVAYSVIGVIVISVFRSLRFDRSRGVVHIDVVGYFVNQYFYFQYLFCKVLKNSRFGLQIWHLHKYMWNVKWIFLLKTKSHFIYMYPVSQYFNRYSECTKLLV